MNTYELTVLFVDKEAQDKTVKAVEAWIKKAKGEVVKNENWGKKTLAYPIKKQAVAEYEHWVLTLPPAQQPELEKMLKMDEGTLRYLFVRV